MDKIAGTSPIAQGKNHLGEGIETGVATTRHPRKMRRTSVITGACGVRRLGKGMWAGNKNKIVKRGRVPVQESVGVSLLPGKRLRIQKVHPVSKRTGRA